MNRSTKCFGRIAVAALALVILPHRTVAQEGSIPRPEHPRPDMMRDDWLSLNGSWEFEFDDADHGVAEQWYARSKPFSRKITVPYCFESSLSGIQDTSFHDVFWYRRTIQVPHAWGTRRVILHFGAVNYEATVWVNGQWAARHQGGQVGFSVDITDYLNGGNNSITMRVWYPSTDLSMPRGKQYWKPKSERIWYTRTAGVWQPVWMEAVDAIHVERLRITPDVDQSQVSIEAILSKSAPNLKLRTSIRMGDELKAQSEVACESDRPVALLKLQEQQLWSPEHPNLYDLMVEVVQDGKVLDTLHSYFGQRKVSVHDGKVYLNNAPYYLKLVLDQGYWPQSVLTPPSDEAMQYDIRMTKAFGFNGARKHQKVEDPRWLYWADKMGLIVWGEMANAQAYDDTYVRRFMDEWQEVVAEDYNHPCIIVWVPINESWGVRNILTNRAQQEHARAMYYLLHSLDQTRLVVDNDGWEHTDATDLFTLHDYARTGDLITAKYKGLEGEHKTIPRNGREALAYGFDYNGTPILITEYGGIAYRIGAPGSDKEWGYSGVEPTKESMLQRLDGVTSALRANPVIAGYCYTQLTDVEQEINTSRIGRQRIMGVR